MKFRVWLAVASENNKRPRRPNEDSDYHGHAAENFVRRVCSDARDADYLVLVEGEDGRVLRYVVRVRTEPSYQSQRVYGRRS